MNKEVIKEVLDYFKEYYDQNFISEVINNNYSSIEKKYKKDDEISLELYMASMLKNSVLVAILNKAMDEDIESELFLIEKYSFIHDLYVRRNEVDANDKLYEDAITVAINTYDGKGSFTAFLYKTICKQYEIDKKKAVVLKKSL